MNHVRCRKIVAKQQSVGHLVRSVAAEVARLVADFVKVRKVAKVSVAEDQSVSNSPLALFFRTLSHAKQRPFIER